MASLSCSHDTMEPALGLSSTEQGWDRSPASQTRPQCSSQGPTPVTRSRPSLIANDKATSQEQGPENMDSELFMVSRPASISVNRMDLLFLETEATIPGLIHGLTHPTVSAAGAGGPGCVLPANDPSPSRGKRPSSW